MDLRRILVCSSALFAIFAVALTAQADTPTRTDILDQSAATEWRTPDPANLLVMRLAGARTVIIELAPDWAPQHVDNIKTLVQQGYFDHTSVYRVQDNFVAQWGDPDGDDPAKAKPMGKAKLELDPEFTRNTSSNFEFTLLPDGDLYAPEVGFSDSMPVARNRLAEKAWLVQCYGMVGVARDVDPRSGNGNTLYVPIGQAPRRLDHQLAVVGRVLEGMQWLAALPRGPEPMGIYDQAEQHTVIESVRLASQLPESERPTLEVLRSDSTSFQRLLDSVRNRQDDFYRFPVGRVSICDAPLPVRERASEPQT